MDPTSLPHPHHYPNIPLTLSQGKPIFFPAPPPAPYLIYCIPRECNHVFSRSFILPSRLLAMALRSIDNLKYLPIILIGLVGIFVIFIVLRVVFSPLRHIPGPFWARFTRAWYFHKVRKADFQWTNIKLHEQYGILSSKIGFCRFAVLILPRAYCPHCT